VSIATDLGLSVGAEPTSDVNLVLYQKTPPDEATLRWIIEHLEDPITDLVRRDSVFTKMALSDADVETADQIVAVLIKTPKLMQRPVVVHGNIAIIGRPKDRIKALLST
jgi:arsenate reductase (glutaredoxin)